MTNRSRLAAPRYEMPEGYTDAIGADESLFNVQPKRASQETKREPHFRFRVSRNLLVARVSEDMRITKQAASVAVDSLLAIVMGGLKPGDRVTLGESEFFDGKTTEVVTAPALKGSKRARAPQIFLNLGPVKLQTEKAPVRTGLQRHVEDDS